MFIYEQEEDAYQISHFWEADAETEVGGYRVTGKWHLGQIRGWGTFGQEETSTLMMMQIWQESLQPMGELGTKLAGLRTPPMGQKRPGSCTAPLPSQRPRAVDKSKPWAQTLTWILKKLQLEAVSQLPPPSQQLGPESFLDTHLWRVLQNDPILDVLWYTDINICLELILFWTSKIYHNCCRLFEYWGKLESVLFTPVLFQGNNVIAHKKSNNNNNNNSLNVCFWLSTFSFPKNIANLTFLSLSFFITKIVVKTH